MPYCAVAPPMSGEVGAKALRLDIEMQGLGLRAHLPRVALRQRVDNGVDRRTPGALEVDQRAVLVEQHAFQCAKRLG